MILATGTRKKLTNIFAATGIFIVGCILGYFISFSEKSSQVNTIREQGVEYKFIKPLLALFRDTIEVPSGGYESIRNTIESYVDNQKKKGLDDVSVYFIDYKNGGSFAINKDKKYYPASMLKVVIMIAYLKKSELNSQILKNNLTFSPNIAQGLEPIPFDLPTKLQVGNTYSVEYLIERMISDSDNGAMNTLLFGIEDEYLNKVYENLGLPKPDNNGGYKISADDYSLFFRVLYNATYLSKLNSEKALSILSTAKWDEGIVSGLPDGVVVAHKYGEHIDGVGDKIDFIELHDCGIVYSDNGPYLICIMTEGRSIEVLTSSIGYISKLVFDSFSKH